MPPPLAAAPEGVVGRLQVGTTLVDGGTDGVVGALVVGLGSWLGGPGGSPESDTRESKTRANFISHIFPRISPFSSRYFAKVRAGYFGKPVDTHFELYISHANLRANIIRYSFARFRFKSKIKCRRKYIKVTETRDEIVSNEKEKENVPGGRWRLV